MDGVTRQDDRSWRQVSIPGSRSSAEQMAMSVDTISLVINLGLGRANPQSWARFARKGCEMGSMVSVALGYDSIVEICSVRESRDCSG